MQIRASTALRNEYLQISQLAKVSGEPIYITNKGEADLVIQAMRDLEGIAQLYLVLAGADSAEKFIDEILHTVDLLRTFPYSGALHPDMVLAEREFRKVICRDYVCVYEVIDSEKTVYIYRIVNGKTDYPQLLY